MQLSRGFCRWTFRPEPRGQTRDWLLTFTAAGACCETGAGVEWGPRCSQPEARRQVQGRSGAPTPWKELWCTLSHQACSVWVSSREPSGKEAGFTVPGVERCCWGRGEGRLPDSTTAVAFQAVPPHSSERV